MASRTAEQCDAIFTANGESFFRASSYSCGPVTDNKHGSYLTMASGVGLKFGIINSVGTFGTVFVSASWPLR